MTAQEARWTTTIRTPTGIPTGTSTGTLTGTSAVARFYCAAPLVLLAHRPVPAENLKDLVGLAKAQPGKINFGSAGVGSAPHLAGEQLRRAARIDINHVPYKGGGPLVNDLLAGHLQLGFTTVPTMVEHVRAGTVRAIAVTGGAREPVAQPADRNGFYADRQHRR